MRLKHIIPSLAALAALLASCSTNDDMTYLDEVQVSSSYVAIAAEGGSTPITVTAKYDWSVAPEDVPEWLTVSPMAGGAGVSTLTFSADAVDGARNATVHLDCNGATQIIEVIQGEAAEAEEVTIAEVMEGPSNKTYRVTGTVTAIANTSYGNFYMNDGTTETDLYIYGTVNSSGSYAWSSFGVDVGDMVTVEGPKSVYGGVVELVDATFIGVTKSLITVSSMDPEDGNVGKEGGEVTVSLSCGGDGVTVGIPEDAQGWMAIGSIASGGGSADVTFRVAANEGGDRSTTITFYTTSGGTEYSCQATITQEGSIIPVSVEEFNAAEVGSTQYRITGYVASVDNERYGNFYIRDFSGETYVYGLDGFQDLGIKEGDLLTIVGKRDEYKGDVEMVDAVLEEWIPVTPISVADFRALPDDNSAYYRLAGAVTVPDEDGTKFDLDTYGNFAVADGTGSVYVYGCSTGVGGEDAKFGTLGVAEGDWITLICYKTSYNGLVEAGGSMYVSHTPAE